MKSTASLSRLDRLLFIFCAVLCALAILLGPTFAYAFNADALFATEVIEALRAGRSLQAYFFPPPGFFFPDLALYGFLHLVLSDFRLVTTIFVVLALAWLAFALLLYAASMDTAESRRTACNRREGNPPTWSRITLSMVVLTGIVLWQESALALFIPLHHGLQTGCTFLAIAWLGHLHKGRWISVLPLLVAFALVLASDPLLWTWLWLPGLGWILWDTTLRQSRALRVWLTLAALALLLRRLLTHLFYLPDPFASSGLDWPDASLWLRPVFWITALSLFAISAFLWQSRRTSQRNRQSVDAAMDERTGYTWRVPAPGLWLLVGQCLTALYFVWHDQPLAWRYFLPALCLLALFFAGSIPDGRLRWGSTLIAIFSYFCFLVLPAGSNLGSPHTTLLPECATFLKEQDACHAGLATYAHARPLALTSRKRIVGVNQELAPHFWMNSYEDYYAVRQAPACGYGFVIMAGMDQELVVRKIGLPDERKTCSGTEIWIYSRKQLHGLIPKRDLDVWRQLTGR